jgi:hypothetical protein
LNLEGLQAGTIAPVVLFIIQPYKNNTMGKLLQGFSGPFTGKLGPAVGSTWMGIPVIRSKPRRRRGGFSEAELAQQAKFRLMSNFLSPVMDLLNETFKQLAVRMTGFNKGYSYNVKNVFTGLYPDLKIDHSLVLLGRGDLPNAGSPAASSSTPGNLDFIWTDNSGRGKARETDKAFVAAYCEEMNQWKYELSVADRNAGIYKLDISHFGGKPVHVYIGFMSADRKEVSDSIYIGIIHVIPS